MLEIVLGVVLHADLGHDPPRLRIADGREGDDFVEQEVLEAESECRDAQLPARSRCPSAPPPGASRSRPTGYPSVLSEGLSPTNPMKGLVPADLHGPEPPAGLLELLFDPIRNRVRLNRGHRRREPFHDAWIGVQRRKGRAVLRPPGSEQQPLGAQRRSRPPPASRYPRCMCRVCNKRPEIPDERYGRCEQCAKAGRNAFRFRLFPARSGAGLAVKAGELVAPCAAPEMAHAARRVQGHISTTRAPGAARARDGHGERAR